jgi:hypothetical protein
MKNKTISLPEYICKLLEQENNASNLIATLLEAHYKSDESIISEVKNKISQKEELKKWGNMIRENHRLQGRLTDGEISDWMFESTLKPKWDEFLSNEN